MAAKYRRTFLIIIAPLFVLTLPVCTFGQQTAEEFVNRGDAKKKHMWDLDGAIADYSKAIELDPKNAGAYIRRGTAEGHRPCTNTQIHKADLDTAIADYSKAIELNPKSSPAYFNRAGAKHAEGDLDGAIADYSKAIELEPKNAEAYSGRGVAKKAKGDQLGADADFAQAGQTLGR